MLIVLILISAAFIAGVVLSGKVVEKIDALKAKAGL